MRFKIASCTQDAFAIHAGKPAAYIAAIGGFVLLSAGCSQVRPYVPPSQGHIAAKSSAE